MEPAQPRAQAKDGHLLVRKAGVDQRQSVVPLIGMKEQPAHNLPQQARCRHHWPKRTPILSHRNIERVHVGPRTGFAHDGSGAADMIGVAVSEYQVLELVWRTAKPANNLSEWSR